MFLDAIRKRNPGLIDATVTFHQSGLLPPNTIVLDADAVAQNATILRKTADELGLHLYFMLKQIRNPQILDYVLDTQQRNETVCVDTDDAELIWNAGYGIGHVGHLVQTPVHAIPRILRMRPEVVTVFSQEKARQISQVAGELGITQSLLLRVAGADDVRFPSMEGGIREEGLKEAAQQIGNLPHVRIVGVTNFPSVFYSETDAPTPTPNLKTSLRCAAALRSMGFEITQVNAPGNTCSLTMRTLAAEGATHVEPGHGLTGTTPFSRDHDLPEIPAMVYVTEILHIWDGFGYVHGGGFYWEDQMILGDDFRNRVLVGNDPESIRDGEAVFAGCSPSDQRILIDYYGVLEQGTKRALRIGDSAVFAFRTQAFATRSAHTAVIRGISEGKPTLLGVYDRCGHRLQRWP